jgi:hypothetical protein
MHVEGTTPGLARRRLSPGRELALVSVLYLLLTAVLTYPTVLRLGSHVPGGFDAPRMIWDIWAFARAATDPQVPMSTTDLIMYPLADAHTTWEATPSLLLGVPLELLLGPLVAYNLLFLLSFVLSGSLAFLLARHLSVNRVASFVAGAIFTFSAYHYVHAMHTHLTSIQWLPLCVLALLRFWDRPSLHRTTHLAVAMVLVVVNSPYYALYFLAPFLVCFFGYYLCSGRTRLFERRFLAGFVLALAVTAGSALLTYPALFSGEQAVTEALRRDSRDTERYSADLMAYLVPSGAHPVFGPLVAPIYASFTAPSNPMEMTVYLGWATLLLAVWGARARGRTAVGFWVLLAVVGFILSLGPVLHVYGRSVIPLPYALLMRLPLFWTARAPSRISVVVILALAVLAGYGLNDVLDRMKNHRRSRMAVAMATLLFLCLESLYSFPYPSYAVSLPPFYQRLLTGSACETLFELPTGPGHDISTYWYMLYQTYHHRLLAHGLVARQRNSEMLFPYWVLRSRFLSPPMGGSSSDTWPAFEASFGDLLAFNRIACVVAQRQAGPSATSYSEEEYGQLKASLQRSLGDPFYEDDGLVAYEIQPRAAETRASFSGKLELVDHKLVETTSCPDGSSSCTFLVTFWRADEDLPGEYGFRLQLVRHNRKRVLAETAHSLGYQFTLGEEVACYNTSCWGPGVVIADYTLLPSTDTEGVRLSEQVDIKIRVTEPRSTVMLPAQSDYYTVDAQGRLLLESYRP